MIAVISCNKYHRKITRLADVGDRDTFAAKVFLNSLGPMECIICGPCSHVELGWEGRLRVHGCYDDVDAAKVAAQKLDKSEYVLKGMDNDEEV